MRNYLYSLLFLLLPTSSVYGQELVATINGTAFHLGDELPLAYPVAQTTPIAPFGLVPS